tara:strand:- start:1206 stop:1865 length:660 start_codon:yes stop_codon:yes gene_type:complete
MKYYCFVQARYSSKRLKGKVLKKFGKHTLLEILLKRLKKSKQINKIIVLTSTSRHDKKIVNLCKKKNIEYFTGSMNNVFLRFKIATKKYKPNKIIRISADSPLMDWRLVDRMIKLSKRIVSFDIISNVKKRTFPKGQSIEIINPHIFELSAKILSNEEKEHVTKYFYEKKKYSIINFKSKKNFNSFNLCVDNYDDFLTISKLIKKKGIFDKWKNYVKEL